MGDRRPFSFRFWSSGTRARANQTIAPPPPPATTTPAPTTITITSVTPPLPETQTPISQPTTTTNNPTVVPPPSAEIQAPASQPTTTTTTNATITTPPPIETQTPVSEPTTTTYNPPTSATPPTREGQEANRSDNTIPYPATVPPSTESKTDNQPTTTTIINHDVDELKTLSPFREITKPPSSPSPTRRTTQSRSPPQPSSPSRVANQQRSTPSSPSRMKTPSTPQRAPQPRPMSCSSSRRSPNQTPSTSPNGTQPSSQSKEPRRSSQEISSSHNEEVLKPAISQHKPQLKAEVESDRVNEINGSRVDEEIFKQDDDEVMPSKSLQFGTTLDPVQSSTTSTPKKKLESTTGNGENDPLIVSNANPEETKDVKEIVETTNNEANGEMKKQGKDFLTPNSESEIIDKQATIDEKDILAASLPTVRPTNSTTSQPKKRSSVLGTHKDIKDDISTFVNRMAIGDRQSTIYDRPVSMITVAGENRGASMQMGSNSSKREGAIHIHRSYKINPDESNAETTSDGERSEKSEHAKGTEDQPTTEAYINNNSQGINNSIVFNSSVAERNPGVNMVVTHVPKEITESTYSKGPLDSQKAAQVTRTEKLMYEPTIRRRCLRGLLLESSDSNPEKPRRHGCRVGCQQRGTENDIAVL